jgi:hypothetical protein
MSVLYRSIYPLSQKGQYQENDNIEFVLSLDGEKLVPGSITLEGECAIFKTGTTGLLGYDRIYYEPRVGYHGIIRNITSTFQNLGIVEQLTDYPRLVKMRALATKFDTDYGSQTDSSVEGRVPTRKMTKGMAEGLTYSVPRGNTTPTSYVPFSLKIENVLNKANAPISSAVTGQIKVQIRLAPNSEFLYGQDLTSATNYRVQNLKLRYLVVTDDGTRVPIQMERYSAFNAIIDSNNQNISTFVPGGLCDSVQMSFISLANQQDSTQCYILCQPPPGIPPLGASQDVAPDSYGLQRITYSINDTDTALVGWTLESREEIVKNGIRAFNPTTTTYSALIRHMRDKQYPDGYITGIGFGGLLNFQQNKFACELESQVTNLNKFSAYLYFRMIDTFEA